MLIGDFAALGVRGVGAATARISTQRGVRAAYLSMNNCASRSIIAAMIVMTAPVLASNPAMAGSCTLTTPAVCSGPASATQTDTAVTISSPQSVTVSTEAGFGYDNTALAVNSIGINLSGNGVNFTDAHNSQIRAGYEALRVQNNGGVTNVNVTGRLESTLTRPASGDTAAFEYASNSTAGAATIVLNDLVGQRTAVKAFQQGTGDLDLTLANAASTTSIAVFASSAGGGDLNLNITGQAVSTNNVGVNTAVRNGGDALIRVNAAVGATGAMSHTHNSIGTSTLEIGSLTSSEGNGLRLTTVATSGDVNITIGSVNTFRQGINGNYSGTGNLRLNVTGDVVVQEQVQVAAITSAQGRDLFVDLVNTTGEGLGINLQNQGTGDTFFNLTGTMRSTAGLGAQIVQRASANNITVNLNNVTAHTTGVYLEHKGRGIADLTTTGLISSGIHYGIQAVANASGGATNSTGMNIRTNNVHADLTAALISYAGKGDVNFTSTGLLRSVKEEGLYARVQATAEDMTVRLNNVEGVLNGVDIIHAGTGVLDVAVSGDVESNAAGLVLVANGQNSGLTVDLQNVTGRTYGLIAENNGVGATNVTTRGTIVGTVNDGLNILGAATSGNMTVNLASATGGERGASVGHVGRGTMDITATGAVTGTTGNGLQSIATATTTNVTVNLASVTGGAHGAYVEHGGTGTTNITATDALTGGTGDGLRFASATTARDLTVNIEEASGGGNGALLSYGGLGAVDVTATGALTGRGGDGLRVATGTAAKGVKVQLADATGSANGVFLSSLGTGVVDATITGQATGNAGDGLAIVTATTNQGVTAAVNGLRGQNNGANIGHEGSGALDFTATGNLVGVTEAGARLVTRTAAEGLTARVQQAQGGTHGVLAMLRGTGTLDFTAEGDLTGTNGHGVYLVTEATANNIVARVGNAEGGQNGVFVEHGGTGDVDLTTTGTVVGNSRIGVAVTTSAATNNANVEVKDVTGSIVGVNIAHSGRGNLELTANGHVRGDDGHGVNLSGAATTNDMIADIQTASGWTNGIFANHAGRGRMDITAAGAVSGEGGDGVGLFATGTVTGVEASVAAVTGSSNGTFIANNGTGDLTFTASGLQKGNIADGVRLTSGSTAGGIAATIGAAEGARNGVSAVHSGSGVLNFASSGNVTGGTDHGVSLISNGAGQGITASVQNARGALAGVYVETANAMPADLTLNGLIQGGEAGVSAKLASGPLTIQNIGTLQNTNGLTASTALVVDSAAGRVQLVNRGTLQGAVRLGGGDDGIDNRGTWNGAGGTHDFGGGADIFTNAASGIFRAAASATAAEITRLNGLERTVNNGLITLADGGANDRLIISGDLQFAAGSVLAVDINGTNEADLVTVGGKASLNGVTLRVTDLGARPVVGSRYTILDAGSLEGEFTINDSHITNFLALRPFYTDTAAGLELLQRRDLDDAADTDNQREVARDVDRLPDGNDIKDNVLDLDSDDQARNAFDQLSGEAHAGVRTTMAEDSRLPRNAVLDRLSQGGNSTIWGKGLWNRSTSDGDRGTAQTKREAWGVLAGADVALGDNLVLGVSGAYLDNDINQHSRSANGKVQSIHVLGYLGLEAGAFRLKAGAGYAWADVETSRSVSFGNFKDRLTADYKANLFQAFGEVGVRVPLGGGYVEPMAQITHLRVKTDGFSEAGGDAALTVQSAVDKTTMSTLGARFETSANGPVSVGGLVGWQRTYGDLTPVSRMNFAGSQGFNIQGVPLSRNAGVVQVEARFRLSDNATLGLGYDGVIGTASQEHAALASFRLAF